MGEPILSHGWFRNGLPLFGAALAWFAVSKGCAAYADYQASCKGLVGDVIKTSEENSAGTGIKLLDIVEIKGGTKTDELTECSGLGIWSNSMKTPVRYKAYKEYDKWWVSYEADPL